MASASGCTQEKGVPQPWEPERHQSLQCGISDNRHSDNIILFFRFEGFMDYSVPEILRVPLEELCLHIMVMPREFRYSFFILFFLKKRKHEDLHFSYPMLLQIFMYFFFFLLLNKYLLHLFLKDIYLIEKESVHEREHTRGSSRRRGRGKSRLVPEHGA